MSDLYPNRDSIYKVMQDVNDTLHEIITNNNEIPLVVVHDRSDPRMFRIVSDSKYEGKLKGVKLIFNNPEDFRNIFPELNKPIPVHLTPNTKQDDDGKVIGKQKDRIDIDNIIDYSNNRVIIKLKEETEIGSFDISFKKLSGFSVAVSIDGKTFDRIKSLIDIKPEILNTSLSYNLKTKVRFILFQFEQNITKNDFNIVLKRSTNL